MSAPPYTRPERRRLETLLARASHLAERIETQPSHAYDAAELAALGWALGEIIAHRGALPEDLERLRAGIWPCGEQTHVHGARHQAALGPPCPRCKSRNTQPLSSAPTTRPTRAAPAWSDRPRLARAGGAFAVPGGATGEP